MPHPIPRSASVKFYSLLLPPSRISIRTLQWLNRPPQPPLCHRRHLHAYKTSRTKTAVGMHPVLPFVRYEAPPTDSSNHKVDLIDQKGKRIISGISLTELYDYVQPGHGLCVAGKVPKPEAENFRLLLESRTASRHRTYLIAELGKKEVKVREPKQEMKPRFRSWAMLKELHVGLSSAEAFFSLTLDRAYNFLSKKHPVEFVIRFKGRKNHRGDKYMPGRADIFPYLHRRFPHLRPDFIIKAMPPETYFLIKPFYDGRLLHFVMATPAPQTPAGDLTRRLQTVREQVIMAIKDNRRMPISAGLRDTVMSGALDPPSSPEDEEELVRRGKEDYRKGKTNIPLDVRMAMLRLYSTGREPDLDGIDWSEAEGEHLLHNRKSLPMFDEEEDIDAPKRYDLIEDLEDKEEGSEASSEKGDGDAAGQAGGRV